MLAFWLIVHNHMIDKNCILSQTYVPCYLLPIPNFCAQGGYLS
jgi:hypothetical protein